MPPLIRPWLCLAAALVLTGCAGKPAPAASDPPTFTGAPVGTGHGSVEDITTALAQQGFPCTDPRPSKEAPQSPQVEQASECDLQPSGEDVLLVHFLGPSGSLAFEREERAADRPGVYADAWGARTETPEAAALLAQALLHRGANA